MSSRKSLEETSSHLFSTAPHIWFQFAVRREMRCVIQVYEHSRLYIEMSIHTHARTLDAEDLNLLDSVKWGIRPGRNREILIFVIMVSMSFVLNLHLWSPPCFSIQPDNAECLGAEYLPTVSQERQFSACSRIVLFSSGEICQNMDLDVNCLEVKCCKTGGLLKVVRIYYSLYNKQCKGHKLFEAKRGKWNKPFFSRQRNPWVVMHSHFKLLTGDNSPQHLHCVVKKWQY